MGSARITQAADKCLDYAAGTDAPFRNVADFLVLLKSDCGWSDADILEVEALVIRGLGKRVGYDAMPS